MNSIALQPDERKTLLDYLRHHTDPQLRLRAHIILLLADGHTWALICSVLFCSSRTIARWKGRFDEGRVPALLGLPKGAAARIPSRFVAIVIDWVLNNTPRAFGFFRSRWSCELVVLLLWRVHQFNVSCETVRRWLHKEDVVWRRPRPALQRKDPRRQEILQDLRQLLLNLPDDETAVFEDEVDLQLNPKIGSMWMRKGKQALVITPGDNDKRYLAGSWHWRTGRLISTTGAKKDAALFVRHLDDLRKRLSRYKKIHLILDNVKIHHNARVLWEYLGEHHEKFVFHFLPKYAPELNPIERVWWILHEEITRNHQCKTMEELVELTLAWLSERNPFKLAAPAYRDLDKRPQPKLAGPTAAPTQAAPADGDLQMRSQSSP